MSVQIRKASVAELSAAIDWVQTSSDRLGTRSATTPASNPNTSVGANCSTLTRLSLIAEEVSVSTSQDMARLCIQVPVTDTAWPKK